MGFCGYSLYGSDEASMMMRNINDSILDLLENHVDRETNEYNTDGMTDVAMYFSEMILPNFYYFESGFLELAIKTKSKIENKLKDYELKIQAGVWGRNKYYEKEMKKLVSKLDKYIVKCSETTDDRIGIKVEELMKVKKD